MDVLAVVSVMSSEVSGAACLLVTNLTPFIIKDGGSDVSVDMREEEEIKVRGLHNDNFFGSTLNAV